MEIPIYKIFNAADANMYKDKLTKGRSAKNNLVKNMINTLGVKSNETKEHAIRVEELALKLGENLNLSYKDMNNLSLLATLHDIGKVTIDETILKKPGRLTESEWKIMKKHTERGYNIANSTDEFSIIAKYILHHHERWDGNGYPERLKQEEIPLLSRIISLVDSFDVMTHDRPYSKAMSVKLALKEVRNCSGSQFDPYLVKEFMKLF
ncbi:MAG: HD-GYP domain-containing protein [Halanaerobiales bacterium]